MAPWTPVRTTPTGPVLRAIALAAICAVIWTQQAQAGTDRCQFEANACDTVARQSSDEGGIPAHMFLAILGSAQTPEPLSQMMPKPAALMVKNATMARPDSGASTGRGLSFRTNVRDASNDFGSAG